MDVRVPKRKWVGSHIKPQQPFPIIIESESGIQAKQELWPVYNGTFDGDCVIVCDPEEMKSLYSTGFFGKGSLSRGYPSRLPKPGMPPVIKQRQWQRRKCWMEKMKNNTCDSDKRKKFVSSTMNNLTGVKSDICKIDSVGTVLSCKLKNNQVEGNTTCDINETNNSDNVEGNTTCDINETNNSDKFEAMDISETDADKNVSHCELRNDRSESTTTCDNSINETSNIDNVEGMDISETDADKNVSHSELQNDRSESTTICDNSINESIDSDKLDSTDISEMDADKSGLHCELQNNRNDNSINVINNSEKLDGMEISEVGGDKSVSVGALQDGPNLINGWNKLKTSAIEKNEDVKNLDSSGKVLVLADSDDEDIEKVIRDPKPCLENETIETVTETLNLTLEEAFFLSYALGCLQVTDISGNLMTIKHLWQTFCRIKSDFIELYVAYHYFRAKGWVVKSGYKFGGDFLLYKQGPPFYHASYIVLVEKLNTKFKRQKTYLTWTKLQGLNRLAEASGKDIIICEVMFCSKLCTDKLKKMPTLLKTVKVNEMLIKRWISSQEREDKEQSLE